MNELSDEVHVYLDVFSTLMLNWVFDELDGTLIFTPKAVRMLVLESKFRKDLSKPHGFLTCIYYCSVLYFC